jgi:hypothetical protein
LCSSHARQGTHQQKRDYALQFADARAETHEIAPTDGYCAAQGSVRISTTIMHVKIRRQFSRRRIKLNRQMMRLTVLLLRSNAFGGLFM